MCLLFFSDKTLQFVLDTKYNKIKKITLSDIFVY